MTLCYSRRECACSYIGIRVQGSHFEVLKGLKGLPWVCVCVCFFMVHYCRSLVASSRTAFSHTKVTTHRLIVQPYVCVVKMSPESYKKQELFSQHVLTCTLLQIECVSVVTLCSLVDSSYLNHPASCL